MYMPRDHTIRRDTGRAVVIHNGNILLIERVRGALHYHSIPGGGIEEGETPPVTALRELQEETGIKAEIGRLLYIWKQAEHTHYFYAASYVSGEPHLPADSEEAGAGPGNIFKPVWVSLNDIEKLELRYWQPVYSQLVRDIRNGFSDEPKNITV